MPYLSVYHGDPFRYYCIFDPEYWEAAQREISPEELAELRQLEDSYQRYQTLLKQIHDRPEVEQPWV